MDGTMVKKQNNNTYEENSIHVIKNRLDVDSIARKIIKEGETEPFYICDVSEIVRRHENWKILMPRVTTHYAVKCNDDRVVLEVMGALGSNFDCASKEEIRKVLSVGISPDRIIYANTVKTISHLLYAAKNRVTMMTFDCEGELYKIKRFCPDAELIIRIKYDDLSAKYVLGEQFGCNHVTQAPCLLQVAAFLGLDVVGVCFHIGSGSKDSLVYGKAIAAARRVCDEAGKFGFKFRLLDIGGGFPGEKNTSIKEIAEVINSALEQYFPEQTIAVTSEPGRYFVTSAFSVASSITLIRLSAEKDPATNEEREVLVYFLDVSIFGALAAVLVNWYFEPRPLNVARDSELHRGVVCGPTPNPFDRITKGVVRMPKMDVGDWMMIDDAGAYTLTLATEFCGYPIPKIHYVVDEDSWLKLSYKVPYPMSRKFVIESNSENFKVSMTGSNLYKTRSVY